MLKTCSAFIEASIEEPQRAVAGESAKGGGVPASDGRWRSSVTLFSSKINHREHRGPGEDSLGGRCGLWGDDPSQPDQAITEPTYAPDDSELPRFMAVDDVRVYRKAEK